MILSGTLLLPNGQPFKDSYVKLIAKSTSEQVLKSVTAGFRTDEDGEYSVDCPLGNYSVVVSGSDGLQTIGSIVIDENTTETNINALILLGDVAASNPLVQQVREDAASALASKNAAAVSATEASDSATDSASSAALSQTSATESAASASSSESSSELATTKAAESVNSATASQVSATASATKADESAASAASASVSATTALSVLGSVNIYADTATGIAATNSTTNKYFSVPVPNSNTFLILYLNNAGVAVQQGTYASKSYIDSLVPTYPTTNSLVPLFVDSVGNVPLYLENGLLAATGVSPALISVISAGIGLRTIIPTNDSSNSLVPVVVDSVGNVPIYLENGLLGATGISPSLATSITASVSPVINLAKTFSDSKTLYKYRANAAKIRTGALSQVKVLMTGDSWTQLSPVSQAIADRLYDLFGKSADGWVSVNTGTNTLNGVTGTLVGVWTQYDSSVAGVAPDHGCGIDGQSMYTTAADARYLVQNITCTEVEIFYQDLNGTFQYRAYDGADWQTVVCEDTDTTKSVKLTGLADNTPRIVEVRTIGNTGTVRLHGLYFTRSAVAGAILNKSGNSGAVAQNIAVCSSQIPYYAAKLDPDVVIIILGTNDYRTGVTISDYETHLGTVIDAYRSAVPTAAFILLAPAKTDGVATLPLGSFRDAMSRVAANKGCEFYSLYDEFGTYAQMNALGMFADSFHLNNAGAAFNAGRLCVKFLNDR